MALLGVETSACGSAATWPSRRVARRRARPHHRAHRTERRGQDHAVQRDHRAADTDHRQVMLDGNDITRLAPHERARRGHGPHVPAARAVRLAHCPREPAGRRRDPQAVGGDDATARIGSTSRHRTGRHADVRRRRADRCPPGRPGWSSSAGRWSPGRSCCCSTSRRRASTTTRPRPSPSCPRGLAADGIAVLLVEHDMPLVMRCVRPSTCSTSAGSSRTGTPDEIQHDQGVHRGLPRRTGHAGVDTDDARRRGRCDRRCSSSAACGPPTGASRCCTASTSRCPPARCSRCSGRTAPARRRR